jgi:hypothetical protein
LAPLLLLLLLLLLVTTLPKSLGRLQQVKVNLQGVIFCRRHIFF